MQRQESTTDERVPGRGTEEADARPLAAPGRGGGGAGAGSGAGAGTGSGAGGGTALPATVRGKMEAAFGADFSAVRIHEGAHVNALGAHAYTQGTDIHFAPGRYQPESAEGQELLGHELAHVVQQASGRVSGVQARGGEIATDLGLEREADDHGARAARGERIAAAPGKLLAIDGRAGGPVQRKELSPEELANLMGQKVGHDVPAGLAVMTGGLGDERALLETGLEYARLSYLEQCERVRSRAPEIAKAIPPFEALNQTMILEYATQLEECKEIGDSKAEEHWIGFEKVESEKGNTKEAYCEKRHIFERKRAAGAWAQAAAPAAQILARLKQITGTGLTEKIQQRTEQKERRDLQGRLGFLLTSTDTGDLLPQALGVNSRDDTSRPQGSGVLAQRLTDVFSTAACHADARRYCDLLSAGQTTGPTKVTVDSQQAIQPLVAAIESAVTGCKSEVKLLKLSVYNNHSVLFVISAGGATRLETVAAVDSKSILLNDLIRGHAQTIPNVIQAIDAGVRGLCRTEGEAVELEYEVHAAATMEEVEERVDHQLRESMAQLTLGLTIGSWEMAGLYERQRQGLQDKKPSETMNDHGVTPVVPRDRLCLPKACATGGNMKFFALDSAAQIAAPVAGTTYRLQCQGSWLRVEVAQVLDAGEPAWLYPMLALRVTKVDRSLADPEVQEVHNDNVVEAELEPKVPERKAQTVMLAMCNGYRREDVPFSAQKDAVNHLEGLVLIHGSTGTWRVSDPDWQSNPTSRRKITLTPI
jgi:Domain of unknown function (DUF4157)